ncbi:MAG TPA: hypothetical protein VF618_00730 [Thermoanaerobaculia bacterium]
MQEIFGLVGMVLAYLVAFALIWAVMRTRQRRNELQAEVQAKLIERFDSAAELTAFLQSQTGQQFVTGVRRTPAFIARNKIISGVSRSIILCSIGLAFVLIAMVMGVSGIAVPGLIFFCLGAGYFAATFVSMKLSEKYGLSDEQQPWQQQSYVAPQPAVPHTYVAPQSYAQPATPPPPEPVATPVITREEELPQS